MGKTIMFHTDENPILSLGFGTFDAFEHSGNFDITDEVTDLEDFEPKGTVIYNQESHLEIQQFLCANNGILLPKLFLPTVRKNCSSDQEKTFEIRG
jgi:hypothetical protein